MCTVLLIFRIHIDYPLILAANRDEFLERTASGPRLLSNLPRSIGGLDLREQGTWLGANEQGFIVGLTNQRTYRVPDRSLQSRGQLVRKLLRSNCIDEIQNRLSEVDPTLYNPFNLFSATRKTCISLTPDRTKNGLPQPRLVLAYMGCRTTESGRRK